MLASGALARDATSLTLSIVGIEFVVDVVLSSVRDGGCFAWFRCQACNRLAMVLRLLNGRLVCRRCDGLLYACQMRRGRDIGRLIELLARPHVNHRARLQLTLQKALLKQKKQAFHHAEKGLAKPDQDPG